MSIPNPYLWKNYKQLAVIPAVLILLAAFFIFTRGIPAGVDLKGGILISIQVDGVVDAALLKQKLSAFSKDVEIRAFSGPAGSGYEIELGTSENLAAAEAGVSAIKEMDLELVRQEAAAGFANQSADKAAAEAKVKDIGAKILEETRRVLALSGSSRDPGTEAHRAAAVAEEEFSTARSAYTQKIMAAVREAVPVKAYSLKEIGASLSKFFFSKIREILVYSFILGAIVVFLVFRSFVPSIAVICGAVADVLIALGGMSAFGIPLTLASTAALLMLIGFSLDTDILLTMRVLKRTEGTMYERAYGAMKTGFMMNFAAMAAFGVLAGVALLLNVPTYYQIGSVVLIGAVADFAATWGMNAVTILWYAERKERTRAGFK
ncbi:MAG: hypothetical protein NTY90_01790 [Candidatus Micrarchaeota archaeon]|nr:hypothetical protein [Candidatus Micrarchaeota archaeon]